jgi:phenylalanyl-tRNA synthetase beta chain
MKILVSWLREFVDVTATPEELGHTLSMRGFELSSLEKVPGTLASGPAPGNGSRNPFPDAVLDFEILANRPDCLSVIGLAREAATAYSLPLKSGAYGCVWVRSGAPGAGPAVIVKLEAADLCPRYSAAVADVTVGAVAGMARGPAAGVRHPPHQ